MSNVCFLIRKETFGPVDAPRHDLIAGYVSLAFRERKKLASSDIVAL